MAALGAEVTGWWFLSSGVVGFLLLLLLLSIFIMALCLDCNRRSFELQHSGVDKNPPALIKVVKLEETRENPMISQIQNDEKQFGRDEENPATFTPWRSHLGAPHTNHDDEASAPITPWRSHLGAALSSDLNASSPPDSDLDHIYHAIRGGSDATSPAANQEPEQQQRRSEVELNDRNSVYARISKKVNMTPVYTPEEEEEEEEEEASPPLPDRSTEMEEE